MNEELDIPMVEKASGFDAKKFEGKKVMIADILVKEETNFYPDGQTYDENSKEKIKRVYFVSEPLHEIDEKGNVSDKLLLMPTADGGVKPVTVQARFNLQKDSSGNWVISKHPKAKLWMALKKLGCATLKEVKEKKPQVMLITEPSKVANDDRLFLRLNL